MHNKSWLRHSQRIAVKMLEKMDELSMTQKQLADMMGCSLQYVSKVLKGQENGSVEKYWGGYKMNIAVFQNSSKLTC